MSRLLFSPDIDIKPALPLVVSGARKKPI